MSLLSKFFCFVLLILLATSTTAIQLSPAKKSLLYNDTQASEYQLRIINDQDKNISVNVKINGPLAQNIQLLPESFSLDEFENDRLVTIRINPMRQDLLKPGRNRVQILVSASTSSNDQFSGAITLAHNLDIIRPYNGAYLESTLRTSDDSLALTLQNLGLSPTIASAKATISDVKNSYPLNLGSQAIAASKSIKLEQSLPDLSPGEYVANATLSYNDPIRGPIVQVQAIKFRHMSILLRYSKLEGSFVPGEIVPITLPIFLRWNTQLTTSTQFALYDGQELLFEQQSPTQILSPKVRSNISYFLDLTTIPAGNYTLAISTFSDGLLIGERREQILVEKRGLVLNTTTTILPIIALAIILVLLAIIALIYVGRKKK